MYEGALAQLLDLDEENAARLARAQGLAFDPQTRTVRVIVETAGLNTSELATGLRSLGAQVLARSDLDRRWSVRIPLSTLGEVAQLPGVRFVRRPYRVKLLQSEIPRYQTGTLPTGALLLQSYGIRGRGVRVAIIDAGFEGLSEALQRGWIAPKTVVETVDYSGKGFETGGDHGTQVARIVHEVAPEAELILMNLGEDGDEVVLENAVEDAIRFGARVINHSIGWFDTNFGDGTGVVDEIARRAYDAGVLWVNAAGNQATSHWMGRLFDRDRDGWAEFGLEREELRVWALFGGVIQLVLVWDDFPTTDQNLDLVLLNWRDEVVASAEAPQRGYDPPREILEYLVEEPGVYRLKVRARRVTRPLRFKVFSLAHEITPYTPHGSVVAPADCACALAVGAMSLYRWEEDGLEGFSARGPTTDGRIKPDLVAPDGVRGFFGTSAAAPHVTGAAALLLSQHPDWDVQQLWDALVENTLDVGPPGPDVESGAGKLRLLLGRPQAVRALSQRGVAAGESLLVTVRVQMPAMRFGVLTLVSRLPPGFILEPVDADENGAVFARPNAREARWTWPTLGPGETRTVTYRLRASPSLGPGLYEITGTLNDLPVAGDGVIEIFPTAEVVVQQQSVAGRVVVRVRGLGSDQRVQVRVFDLSGRQRFDSGLARGARLALPVDRTWANGIYLAVVEVRGPDGKSLVREVRKILVMR